MDDYNFYKRIKQIEVIASRYVESFFAGNYRSVFKGQGIEFDEVREYGESDDVRLIDWNVTSRMGAPYTKVFKEEREIILFLVVDCSASLFTGAGKHAKSELEALVFAILGISAVSNNDRVGGVFFTDRIERWVPPLKGKRHILRLINDLLVIEPRGKGSDLRLALKAVGKFLKRKSVCVILSDFKTSGYWNELSIVARKHDVIAISLTDPADKAFPSEGTMEIEDPETGRIVLASGKNESFRAAYSSYWADRRRIFNSECAKRKVEILDLSVTDDPALTLMEFFERRKRRWHRY
jgi:uncharacterized protein (DUF58 family)